jgi:hypothetical protein
MHSNPGGLGLRVPHLRERGLAGDSRGQAAKYGYSPMNPPTPVRAADAAFPVLASPPIPRAAADLLGLVLAVRDLDQQPCPPPSWLWRGYLAPRQLTLLTSQWKCCKSTLLALLLARLQQGGQLLGVPVAPGRALVIFEKRA